MKLQQNVLPEATLFFPAIESSSFVLLFLAFNSSKHMFCTGHQPEAGLWTSKAQPCVLVFYVRKNRRSIVPPFYQSLASLLMCSDLHFIRKSFVFSIASLAAVGCGEPQRSIVGHISFLKMKPLSREGERLKWFLLTQLVETALRSMCSCSRSPVLAPPTFQRFWARKRIKRSERNLF